MSRGAGRRGGEADHVIGDSLAAFLKDQGFTGVKRLSVIDRAWEEAAGPECAAHLHPVALRDEVLVVAASDAAWAAQLPFVADAILTRLRAVVGSDAPERLEARRRPGLSGSPRAPGLR